MRGPYKWILVAVVPVVICLLIAPRFFNRSSGAWEQPAAAECSHDAAAPRAPAAEIYSNDYAAPQQPAAPAICEAAPETLEAPAAPKPRVQKYSNDYAEPREVIAAPKAACECAEAPKPAEWCHRGVIGEIKASCFIPTQEKTRKIYSDTMGMYGVELSVKTGSWLYPWASGSVIVQDGHSRATVVPVGFGLKAMRHFKHAGIYAGAGPLYSYLHVRGRSEVSSSSQWDWGGIAKAGVILFTNHTFLVDLFADYSYMKFDHHGSGEVNFSGWSVGGAIGIAF